MADLHDIQFDDAPVDVDHDNYVNPSEMGPPIPAGTYLLKAGKPDFNVSTEGWPSATFDHTVEGGEEDGKSVRFDRISTKPFERGGVKVSFAADFLRSCGDTGRPSTKQQYVEALNAQEGKPFKAMVDWEAYCKVCENSVKGMKSFGEDENGVRQSRISCPTGCMDDEKGEPNLIYANARITRYVPA